MIRTVVYNPIQLLFVIGLAPLYAGVLSRFKEIVQSDWAPAQSRHPCAFRQLSLTGCPDGKTRRLP